ARSPLKDLARPRTVSKVSPEDAADFNGWAGTARGTVGGIAESAARTVEVGLAGVSSAGAAGRLRAVFMKRPRRPSGMNRITTTRIKPTAARPATAKSPAVKTYSSPVMTVAPTAGPSQCRVPPNTLINTTVSGTNTEKVSPTVT